MTTPTPESTVQAISREKDAKFPPEKGRYHLYVANGCPFAHRALLACGMKGLEDVISVTFVHPTWQHTKPGEDTHTGWVFANPNGDPVRNSDGNGGPFPAMYPETQPDPYGGAKSIREVYERDGRTGVAYSVPVLYDTQLNTIVNTQSAEIARMIHLEFNEFAKRPELDLYPIHLREEIDEVIKWLDPQFNLGVYRCGFATSQGDYDKAIIEVTEAFDRIHDILQRQRYMVGNCVTEADIRCFASLLRFDEVYAVYFKINTRSVLNTPALLNYCREIYQMPGVKETIHMELIKLCYYTSKPVFNHYSIVPRGPNFISWLEMPHDRDQLFPPVK